MIDRVYSHPQMTKREFLKFCGAGFCLISAPYLFGFPKNSQAQMAKKGLIKTKLSPYFTSLEGGEIQCELCPHRCRVAKGKRGICRVRENRDGKYYSLVYGNPCAVHLDPIEKKPFSMSSPARLPSPLPQQVAIFSASFARIGKSPRLFRRISTVMRFHQI